MGSIQGSEEVTEPGSILDPSPAKGSSTNASESENVPPAAPIDPLVLYSQTMYDYTLHLWAESRRQAEVKARARAMRTAAKKETESAKDGDDKS